MPASQSATALMGAEQLSEESVKRGTLRLNRHPSSAKHTGLRRLDQKLSLTEQPNGAPSMYISLKVITTEKIRNCTGVDPCILQLL